MLAIAHLIGSVCFDELCILATAHRNNMGSELFSYLNTDNSCATARPKYQHL
jgi:hypothetical protein